MDGYQVTPVADSTILAWEVEVGSPWHNMTIMQELEHKAEDITILPGAWVTVAYSDDDDNDTVYEEYAYVCAIRQPAGISSTIEQKRICICWGVKEPGEKSKITSFVLSRLFQVIEPKSITAILPLPVNGTVSRGRIEKGKRVMLDSGKLLTDRNFVQQIVKFLPEHAEDDNEEDNANGDDKHDDEYGNEQDNEHGNEHSKEDGKEDDATNDNEKANVAHDSEDDDGNSNQDNDPTPSRAKHQHKQHLPAPTSSLAQKQAIRRVVTRLHRDKRTKYCEIRAVVKAMMVMESYPLGLQGVCLQERRKVEHSIAVIEKNRVMKEELESLHVDGDDCLMDICRESRSMQDAERAGRSTRGRRK